VGRSVLGYGEEESQGRGKAEPSSIGRKFVQRHKTEREIAVETRRKAREKNTAWNFNNIDQPQRQ